MKKTLLVLVGLLYSLASIAQFQLPDRAIYRGNPYVFALTLNKADSAQLVTAILRVRPYGPPVENVNQPVVTRSGRKAFFSWEDTRTLPDPKGWLEIQVAGTTKYTAWVITTKTVPNVPTTGGVVVVPTPDDQPAPVAAPSVSSKPYRVANVPATGYYVQHFKASRLVTATFFREDTGQVDQLWQILIVNDNAVQVAGPKGETFSGTIVLSFIPQLTN